MHIEKLLAPTAIIGLLSALLLTAPLSSQALASQPAAAGQSHILVHILELEGTGPDGKTWTLYRSSAGFTTPLRALGRVGSQVSGNHLPEGAYHTLYVRLRDDYTVIRPDGSSRQGDFKQEGKPTTIRVRGMIMVKGGNPTPVRMLPEIGHGRPGRGRYGDDDD